MPKIGSKHYSYDKKGKKDFIADKIKLLMDEGKKQPQAVAIALSLSRKKKGKKKYG